MTVTENRMDQYIKVPTKENEKTPGKFKIKILKLILNISLTCFEEMEYLINFIGRVD